MKAGEISSLGAEEKEFALLDHPRNTRNDAKKEKAGGRALVIIGWLGPPQKQGDAPAAANAPFEVRAYY
jgi:hypothetical protein